jgi:hypothetical protein
MSLPVGHVTNTKPEIKYIKIINMHAYGLFLHVINRYYNLSTVCGCMCNITLLCVFKFYLYIVIDSKVTAGGTYVDRHKNVSFLKKCRLQIAMWYLSHVLSQKTDNSILLCECSWPGRLCGRIRALPNALQHI